MTCATQHTALVEFPVIALTDPECCPEGTWNNEICRGLGIGLTLELSQLLVSESQRKDDLSWLCWCAS